ncbi:unnamed protein product [Arctogadus glacialis]
MAACNSSVPPRARTHAHVRSAARTRPKKNGSGRGQQEEACKCTASFQHYHNLSQILPTQKCTLTVTEEDSCACIVRAWTHSLFTPYQHAVRPEHQCYNTAVWQREEWFPVSPNKLCLEPRRFCMVIISTALLHNYLKQHGHPGPHVADDRLVPMVEEANDRNGRVNRDAFALQFL